ncbi:MAG: hypothetical protein QOD44_132 [Solirubrobacteraceae bacterium]|jgi:hypothetical protein|nr:hypothetical protein [Solirubrobacteraceae bacterium]MEA2315943.1 hypothetical protein [Solirubrobacteraceae bacterium]
MLRSSADDVHPEAEAGEVEEVDAVPVLVQDGPIERVRPAGQMVVRQAAAVAATSFAAGVATVAVVHARNVRRRRRRSRRALAPILVSRSFLVDVHLLDTRD